MNSLRDDANLIISKAISDAMPDNAVREALGKITFNNGRIVLVAIGKAAWPMANSAYGELKDRITKGIVITKYEHSKGPIGSLEIHEAAHPVPDENGFSATKRALELVSGLDKDDNVLFLISGGGSALFECPLVEGRELKDITSQLLACGAAIEEINTIRKHLSSVKGGRFALACRPAHVFSIVLSDVLGDRLDTIASGPAYPDGTTSAQSLDIIKKYSLKLSKQAINCLSNETPKSLDNVTTFITGSVSQLCRSASEKAVELGYEPVVLTDKLTIQARVAGVEIAKLAIQKSGAKPIALIEGGETVVKLTGHGKGGRNQEFALAASPIISGYDNICVFSVGSDGTDGPTDAAGGYVDGKTAENLKTKGLDIEKVLYDNDSYNALKVCDGLIITGPTGTNVNDLAVALVRASN